MKYSIPSMRPQDILILLKKTTHDGRLMNNKELASSLHISASEISESLERCRLARLVNSSKKRVNILTFLEFLIHGVKYVYPVIPLGVVRGLPTASSSSPLKEKLSQTADSFVWQYKEGKIRGQAIVPLYPSVPKAVLEDEELHVLLALVDAIRIGNSREQEIAVKELEEILLNYGKE